MDFQLGGHQRRSSFIIGLDGEETQNIDYFPQCAKSGNFTPTYSSSILYLQNLFVLLLLLKVANFEQRGGNRGQNIPKMASPPNSYTNFNNGHVVVFGPKGQPNF